MAEFDNGYVTVPTVWTDLNGLAVHKLSGTDGVMVLNVGNSYVLSLTNETANLGSAGVAIYIGDKPVTETLFGSESLYNGQTILLEKINTDSIWIKGIEGQTKLTVRRIK